MFSSFHRPTVIARRFKSVDRYKPCQPGRWDGEPDLEGSLKESFAAPIQPRSFQRRSLHQSLRRCGLVGRTSVGQRHSNQEQDHSQKHQQTQHIRFIVEIGDAIWR